MSEEIRSKHEQFQAAVADMTARKVEYEEITTAYLEKKQSYIDSITTVDTLDNELEALTQAYEPPAPPVAQ